MNSGRFGSRHLGDSILRALLQGQPVLPDVGAHFILCKTCQERLRELAPAHAERLLDLIQPLVQRLQSQGEDVLLALVHETANEIDRARELLETVLQSSDIRRHFQDCGASFHALGVVVLEKARHLRQSAPAKLQAVCHEVLERLRDEPVPIPGQAAFDLRAQLEAELGNALRILARFAEARLPVTRALNFARSSPDRLVRANVRWLASLYFIDMGCFAEAELLACSALDSYTAFGRVREIEAAEYTLATIPYHRGDLDEALQRLEALLKRNLEDPLTELSVVHLAAKIHTLKGDYFPAGNFLSRLRSLSEPWRDCPGIQMNIQWVRGLIIAGTSEKEQGIRLLEEVRDFYIGEEIQFDAALVMVDLAYWRLQASQPKEAIEDAAGAVRIFEIEKTEFPQALAAVRLFAEAVRHEHLEMGLYRELVVYLDRTRRDPELTFDPRNRRD